MNAARCLVAAVVLFLVAAVAAAALPPTVAVLLDQGAYNTSRSMPVQTTPDTGTFPVATTVLAVDFATPPGVACTGLVADVALWRLAAASGPARPPTYATFWLWPGAAALTEPPLRNWSSTAPSILWTGLMVAPEGGWPAADADTHVDAGTRRFTLARASPPFPAGALAPGASYWLGVSVTLPRALNRTDGAYNAIRWMAAVPGTARAGHTYAVIDRWNNGYASAWPALRYWTGAAAAEPLLMHLYNGTTAAAGAAAQASDSQELAVALFGTNCSGLGADDAWARAAVPAPYRLGGAPSPPLLAPLPAAAVPSAPQEPVPPPPPPPPSPWAAPPANATPGDPVPITVSSALLLGSPPPPPPPPLLLISPAPDSGNSSNSSEPVEAGPSQVALVATGAALSAVILALVAVIAWLLVERRRRYLLSVDMNDLEMMTRNHNLMHNNDVLLTDDEGDDGDAAADDEGGASDDEGAKADAEEASVLLGLDTAEDEEGAQHGVNATRYRDRADPAQDSLDESLRIARTVIRSGSRASGNGTRR